MPDDEFALPLSPAPWSPVARDDPERGRDAVESLVDSGAQRRLVREIQRYARGEILGRAFLIAGHRGAGKTTAVLTAMQQVYNECRNEFDTLGCFRPLLVRLHAPSLVLDSASEATAPEGGDASSRHSVRFLREMAAGIFPALIDELRRLLLAQNRSGASFDRELVAHLCDELGRGISLAEQREIFRRLGRIEKGVLGRRDAFQELVAIQAASEAYLIVTGKLETELNSANAANGSSTIESAHSFDVEKLVHALTPVAAATALGVGIANDIVLAGSVVAAGTLISGFGATWKTKRERSRTAASTRSFKTDNSHASLVRRVPLLVEQLREIGFPIVFVLDEVDKLESPSPEELLGWILTRLKSYVTERSFLCFVVERSYYERLVNKRPVAAGNPPGPPPANPPGAPPPPTSGPPPTNPGGSGSYPPYGIQHTFYSDTAYIIPTFGAVHAYLRRILEEDKNETGATERAVFRHALLNRSKVHLYDLHREVERARAAREISASGSTSGMRSSWHYEAFLQCGIEWVLTETRIRAHVDDDPYFFQIAHDLLYAIGTRWREEEPMDLSSSAIATSIANSTLAPKDRPLVTRAITEFVATLSNPRELLDQIRTERDLGRLEHFCREGELAPGGRAIADAQTDLASSGLELDGRDPTRLVRCFASRKYAVLVFVTNRPIRRLRAPGRSEWLVDPRGYRVDEALSEEEVERIDDLLKFRRHYETTRLPPGPDFVEVWNSAMPDSIDAWEQFERARAEHELNASDPESTSVLKRFADNGPNASRLVEVVRFGVGMLAAIERGSSGRVARSDPSELLRVLKPALLGTHATSRASSLATTLLALAELYSIRMTDRVRGMLISTATPLERDQPPAPLFLDMVDLALEAAPRRDADARAMWWDSIAHRIVDALDGVIPTRTSVEDRARLDLLAGLLRWIPRAFAPIWTIPSDEWTIRMCCELSRATGADVEAPPPWLRAFAASKVGLVNLARRFIDETSPAQLSPAIGRVVDKILESLSRTRPDVVPFVLLNPGPVMTQWRPIPGFRSISVDGVDVDSFAVDLAKSGAVIFIEGMRERPAGVLDAQCAVVVPRPGGDRLDWGRTADGTVVLFGPETLDEALRRFFEAVHASTSGES